MYENRFTNSEVAKLLRNVAAAYILLGENHFKVIAYEKAADAIEALSQEAKDIWQEGKLDKVPSLGPSIRSHLDELFRIGYSKHFDSILKKIPSTVFKLMDIPGIGPKKAYKLVKNLHLKNDKTFIKDLKAAIEKNKISDLPNFGEKSQEDIAKTINVYEQRLEKQVRMPLPYAFDVAEEMLRYLKQNPKVMRVDVLGSLRRMQSTIGDVDIAVAAADNDSKAIIEYFIKYPKAIRVENAGEKKASIIISPYIRFDLRIEPEKSYGSMLQYFTGSKTHNIKLREYALKKGFSLSEYGLKEIRNPKSAIREFAEEEKLYEFLGLQYIPPEIREGTDEIKTASQHKIPVLVGLKDIKGDLHIHSSFNIKPSHDLGADSFEEIMNNAKRMGYEFIGFTDHNPKASLSEDEIINIVKKRKKEIDKYTNVFAGLEVDIQPDGELALPTAALPFVDYLIASVHSVFNMDEEQMTQRIISALSNPKVRILGHPTGHMLGKREGYKLEWEKIFSVCRKNDIALEINSWPERLDLPDTLVKTAIDNGVKLVINTDSHAKNQMDNMLYGVTVARRGWAKKSDILNTLSLKNFKKWLTQESR